MRGLDAVLGRRLRTHITAPLAVAFADRFKTFLPKATYPLRAGVHSNTAFALRLAFGIMAVETLLASRRAVPRVALDLGFRFSDGPHPLEDACRRALRRP